MINVHQAEEIIFSQIKNFGTEEIFYENALGRILAENIVADGDLPPFDRSTVDGIAINFNANEKSFRTFKIKAIQSAGEPPISIDSEDECLEIMTGAALHSSVDTVIRYEDILINNNNASINIAITKGQNIHYKGKDKKAGEILVKANQLITSSILGLAASVGKTILTVKKLPKVIIISTGNEMVPPETIPTPFQLRRSNGITIKSVLEKYKIYAEWQHWNDDFQLITNELSKCLDEYDILLISGGVSMGKFDYLPKACEELGVEKAFSQNKTKTRKTILVRKKPKRKIGFCISGESGFRVYVFAPLFYSLAGKIFGNSGNSTIRRFAE